MVSRLLGSGAGYLKMKFHELELDGVYLMEPERIGDERGFFARGFCQKEFIAQGLNPRVAQCNLSFNRKAGTLRGMHYQVAPYSEVKVVRCTRGAIFDVVIDLRPDSRSYLKWLGMELTQENRHLLYVPEGFAHGFQTLKPDSEVFYQVSEFYSPEHERGVRWDDPLFSIDWPAAESRVISEKDRNHADYEAEARA